MALKNLLHFFRRSDTALVLVMPHKLVQRYNLPKGIHDNVGYKHYVDDFVSKARKRGARIVYLEYSHMLWRQMIPAADDIFVFETDLGYMKFRKGIGERALSKGEERELEQKKRLAVPVGSSAEDGLKMGLEDYAPAAERLARILHDAGITSILMCGGTADRDMAFLIGSLRKYPPQFSIQVSSQFLVRGYGRMPFGELLVDGDADALLKLL